MLCALVFACGGIGDTTDPDVRMIQSKTHFRADGLSYVEETILGIDMSWQTQDTEIDGPWFEPKRTEGELGQLGQAFSYGNLSRFGFFPTSTTSDKRCPDTWGAGHVCVVPGTKTFKWLYYPNSSDSQDLISVADLYTEWVQAQAVMSVGGFSHCTGLVCQSAPPFNAWFDNTEGSCDGATDADLACTFLIRGSTFTHGGKQFRKTIAGNQIGWNAGFPAFAAINVEPSNLNQSAINWGSDATQRRNFVQNVLEHELGHVNGLAHTTSGSSLMTPTPNAAYLNDPGANPGAVETAGMASYSP
jgi:hypothetical protein